MIAAHLYSYCLCRRQLRKLAMPISASNPSSNQILDGMITIDERA